MTFTWQWILSQALGLVVLILAVVGFQMKNKSLMLVFIAISNAMSAAAQALLTNYIMAGLAAIVVVRLFVYAWLQSKRERVPLWFDIGIVVFFLAANVPVAVLTASWWFDWLFFGFITAVTFCQWLDNPHIVRLSPIPVTIMILIAGIYYNNFMSIITEAFVLVSITVFYARLFFQRQQPLLNFQPRPKAG